MKLSDSWRRRTLPVALVALAVPLLSCEDDTPTDPIVIVTPAPVRGVLAQTAFSGFQTDVWVSIEILVSQRGAIDATVDWTFADTWMYVYFGGQKCDLGQLTGGTCPFIVASEAQSPKPRVLQTAQLEPGTYYLVLYNVPRDRVRGIGSDNTEAVAVQLGLTIFPSIGSGGEGAIKLGRVQVIPRL
jgi:hypothetical protein